ncbi:MAG: MotA/TolQ/ExbB proton channel family protein [Alphaproteobacteria bacterium]
MKLMTVKSLVAAAAFAVSAAVITPSAPAMAQDGTSSLTLDQLVEMVKTGRVKENQENKRREAEFKRARDRQADLLREAEEEVAREEARSSALEKEFQDNEIKLADLEGLLAERLGAFGELFGVVRQVAGDTEAQIYNSLISTQLQNRTEGLRALAGSKELPRIDQLNVLWAALMEEAVQQGKVVKYNTTVLTPGGEPTERQVTRIGPFVAISEGKYLQYSSGQLVELGRQPGARVLGAAENIENAAPGEVVAAAVDPSRGAILSLLVLAPSITERIDQGAEIGYIIIGLGIIGVLMALERIITLSLTAFKVRGQMKDTGNPGNNPLGRVLQAYKDNESVDVETLELKLDDAILKETPKLERGLAMLKVMAAVAPLLGLLGTVTGMIETFQAITLFGTGDPKLMAGGISQALITTVLGLCAAIPVLLLHAVAAGRSKLVLGILEEQSAGIVARHAEDHPHTA